MAQIVNYIRNKKIEVSRHGLYHYAEGFVGLAEVPGDKSHELILKWIRYWGDRGVKDDGKYAWCSVFVLEMCLQTGRDFGKATPAAKSWLKVGKPVGSLAEAQQDDILVYDRKPYGGWQGHVAIYSGRRNVYDHRAITVSGNKDNQVDVTADWESIDERLEGIRRLDFAGDADIINVVT